MPRPVLDSLAFTALAEKRWGPKRHWHCAYCGRGSGLTVDHFWPLNDGGTDDIWNSVPVCYECNRAKSDRAPIAWLVAVGVPERRIAAIVTTVHTRDWVAPRPQGELTPRMPQITRANLDYAAGRAVPRVAARPAPAPAVPRADGLPAALALDPDAWSPRGALWAAASSSPEGRERWSSARELYADLRSRGFREMKRTGAWGFWGLAAAPKS